jgi:mRNA interferase YafQ
MLQLSYSTQMKRDIKRMKKRGKDMRKLKELLSILAKCGELPEHFRDHSLRGNWVGFRDAHIEPDWILIYKISDASLRLERTGSHSDLFR